MTFCTSVFLHSCTRNYFVIMITQDKCQMAEKSYNICLQSLTDWLYCSLFILKDWLLSSGDRSVVGGKSRAFSHVWRAAQHCAMGISRGKPPNRHKLLVMSTQTAEQQIVPVLVAGKQNVSQNSGSSRLLMHKMKWFFEMPSHFLFIPIIA